MSAKLNDIDQQAWRADVLARIADTPVGELEQLLPWNWRPRTERSSSLTCGLHRVLATKIRHLATPETQTFIQIDRRVYQWRRLIENFFQAQRVQSHRHTTRQTDRNFSAMIYACATVTKHKIDLNGAPKQQELGDYQTAAYIASIRQIAETMRHRDLTESRQTNKSAGASPVDRSEPEENRF
ncbi:transposase domain-containing protein [Rhizobium leguminosarum]|uniref:transposase domain-containing protein n=2 Tax=Rhizobium TaxID=379 RepID=UPI001C970A86|nr:transposase domain-containing protein [Rhizobium leguminosarum]